jgi:mono/diheme cytochrome c family protein
MAIRYRNIIPTLTILAALLPASAAAGDIDGETLFRDNCAPCHGEEGRGGGPVASAIAMPIPQLATLTERNEGEFPRDYVVQIVDGREPVLAHGTRTMPVWGAVFEAYSTDGDDAPSASELIEAIVDYVEGFQVE